MPTPEPPRGVAGLGLTAERHRTAVTAQQQTCFTSFRGGA